MGSLSIDPVARRLLEAEGYLELGLPGRALEILQGRVEWATMAFEANVLLGEALRGLDRHGEALRPLEAAARLRPDDLGVALAQGWCFKRSNRLAQAIDALERAARHHPEVALVHYNLACYWSLAGQATRALAKLGEALAMDAAVRGLVAEESDFDPIRALPEFRRLLSEGPAG